MDEVRETLRCSREHAERYIERTLDGRTVHNPFAYIRQSLRNHQDAAATSPKPKGTGKAAGSGKGTGKGTDRSAPVRSGTGTGSGSGRGRRTTHEERAEAVAALQEGRETVADVTARLGSSPITVKAWWADADRKAAFHAVRNGEDVADVLTRYPRCPRHMEPVLREIAQGNRRAS